MSILERIIEEQQNTIDGLKAELERSENARKAQAKSFAEYYDKRNKFFKHLNRLTDGTSWKHIDPATAPAEDWEEWKHEVRMYMMDCGWCRNCETTKCFGDCYD